LSIHLINTIMKKLLISLIAIICFFAANAQITITDADLPQPGSAAIVSNDTTTIVDIGVASASSQAWNFTGLLNHYPKYAIYSPTAPYQQYATDFPGSNIYTWGPSIFFTSYYGSAPVYSPGWGYMYWKTDMAGFHIVGFRGDAGGNYGYMNVHENPQELLMGAPATYGIQFPDSARWVVKLDRNHADTDSIYKSILKKTLTCDAFGTLTTPSPHLGNTYNVLRVHEYVIIVDSIEARVAVMGDTLTIPIWQYKDTLNNYYFWANGIHYPVAIVHCDKNNNVKDVEYITDTISCYSITGTVYNTDGSYKVTNGTASLIIKDSYNHLFSWLETVNIDTNGHYQFASVLGGYFLVLADPDQVQYPYLLPTYYGDTTYWENATALWMTHDTSLTIYCRNDSLLAQFQGQGNINGYVYVDTLAVNKFAPSNTTPARGVKVTLEQNPGGACRLSTTDADGAFHFNNLPVVSYKIKVDIPGLVMDSTYHITLMAKSLDYSNLGFWYDTSKIYVYYQTSINDHNVNSAYDVKVYPNPFSNSASIYVSNPYNENRVITFKVYDIVGRVIKEITVENTDVIGFNDYGMTKGMYIYELQVNREVVNSGKIVVN
jgi:hypothetical protein